MREGEDEVEEVLRLLPAVQWMQKQQEQSLLSSCAPQGKGLQVKKDKKEK